MQEHDHVKTIPGEPKAPEIVLHAVHPEPGANTQAEDINIPLVALTIAFFACLLLILMVSLEAWFYHQQEAERVAKQVPQGAPGTPLGDLLESERAELYPVSGAGWSAHSAKPQTVPTISIDRAMELVAQDYAAAQTPH